MECVSSMTTLGEIRSREAPERKLPKALELGGSRRINRGQVRMEGQVRIGYRLEKRSKGYSIGMTSRYFSPCRIASGLTRVSNV
jgi:hypothetical protein